MKFLAPSVLISLLTVNFAFGQTVGSSASSHSLFLRGVKQAAENDSETLQALGVEPTTPGSDVTDVKEFINKRFNLSAQQASRQGTVILAVDENGKPLAIEQG